MLRFETKLYGVTIPTALNYSTDETKSKPDDPMTLS